MIHVDNDYYHYYFNGDYSNQEIEDYGKEEQYQEINEKHDNEDKENSLEDSHMQKYTNTLTLDLGFSKADNCKLAF